MVLTVARTLMRRVRAAYCFIALICLLAPSAIFMVETSPVLADSVGGTVGSVVRTLNPAPNGNSAGNGRAVAFDQARATYLLRGHSIRTFTL